MSHPDPSRPLLCLLIAGSLGGCAPPVLDETPAISILFPVSSEETVYCPTLMVVVDVDGFTLSPEGINQTPVEGEGHWHLEVNGEYIGSTGDNTFFVDQSLALEPGRVHALVGTLRTNEHEPLDPDIRSGEVEIQVEDTDDCVGGVGSDADSGA